MSRHCTCMSLGHGRTAGVAHLHHGCELLQRLVFVAMDIVEKCRKMLFVESCENDIFHVACFDTSRIDIFVCCPCFVNHAAFFMCDSCSELFRSHSTHELHVSVLFRMVWNPWKLVQVCVNEKHVVGGTGWRSTLAKHLLFQQTAATAPFQLHGAPLSAFPAPDQCHLKHKPLVGDKSTRTPF